MYAIHVPSRSVLSIAWYLHHIRIKRYKNGPIVAEPRMVFSLFAIEHFWYNMMTLFSLFLIKENANMLTFLAGDIWLLIISRYAIYWYYKPASSRSRLRGGLFIPTQETISSFSIPKSGYLVLFCRSLFWSRKQRHTTIIPTNKAIKQRSRDIEWKHNMYIHPCTPQSSL